MTLTASSVGRNAAACPVGLTITFISKGRSSFAKIELELTATTYARQALWDKSTNSVILGFGNNEASELLQQPIGRVAHDFVTRNELRIRIA
jgi:hypothetical protein